MQTQVIHCIAQSIGLNESEITPASTSASLDMDSLDEIEMIMALEDEFGIEIRDDQFQPLQTVGQIIELVTSLKAAADA